MSQDLPALYLQGGSIIPSGPPLQHIEESKLSDDVTLLIALDRHGTASFLFCISFMLVSVLNFLIFKYLVKGKVSTRYLGLCHAFAPLFICYALTSHM